MGNKKAFTVKEAAQELTVGESKIRELVKNKAIVSIRIGDRIVIPAWAIDAFLSGNQTPACTAGSK